METQVKVKKKYHRVSKKKAAQAVSKWYETFPAARTILRQNRNGITITQSRDVPINYSQLEEKILAQNEGKIPSGDLYTDIMNAVGNITRNEVKSVAMMFLFNLFALQSYEFFVNDAVLNKKIVCGALE